MLKNFCRIKSLIFLLLIVNSFTVYALENQRIHYSQSGTLVADISASEESATYGFFGSLSALRGEVTGVAFGDGTNLSPTTVSNIPIGSPALGTVSGTLNINANFSQKVSGFNLIGGYSFKDRFLGGRFNLSTAMPILDITRSPNITLSSISGASCSSNLLTSNQCSIASISIAQKFISNLNSANSASDSGVGDLVTEITWSRNIDRTKFVLGIGVTAPTGSYNVTTPVNIGLGYWSYTPTVAAIYSNSKLVLAGRISYQYNLTNTNSTYSSGNVVIAEISGLTKIPDIGIFGINTIHVNQLTDDYLGTPTSITGYLYSVNTPNSDGNRMRYLSFTPYYAIPLVDTNSIISISYSWKSTAVYSQLSNLFLIKFSKKF
jgi:hypothetical protein